MALAFTFSLLFACLLREEGLLSRTLELGGERLLSVMFSESYRKPEPGFNPADSLIQRNRDPSS